MAADFESYITERVQQLENQALRLKILLAVQAIALLVGLYFLLPVGSWLGVPKTLEASRFVLVDERGRVRGEWQVDEGPQLELFTASGKFRAGLSINHDGGAFLGLSDNQDGAGRNVVLSASDAGTELTMTDEKGTRASVIIGHGKTGIRIIGDDGKPLLTQP